jgi:transposase
MLILWQYPSGKKKLREVPAMARRIITDEIWEKLLVTTKQKGCRNTKDNKEVMEAILWKLRTGAPWRDIPEEFCPWQTAFNRFNRWAKRGLWEDFFLNLEEKLIRSGLSQTEVMFELINMQVELGMEKKEQSENLVEALPQKFMWSPMRMGTRFLLKSLGVKFTTRS